MPLIIPCPGDLTKANQMSRLTDAWQRCAATACLHRSTTTVPTPSATGSRESANPMRRPPRARRCGSSAYGSRPLTPTRRPTVQALASVASARLARRAPSPRPPSRPPAVSTVAFAPTAPTDPHAKPTSRIGSHLERQVIDCLNRTACFTQPRQADDHHHPVAISRVTDHPSTRTSTAPPNSPKDPRLHRSSTEDNSIKFSGPSRIAPGAVGSPSTGNTIHPPESPAGGSSSPSSSSFIVQGQPSTFLHDFSASKRLLCLSPHRKPSPGNTSTFALSNRKRLQRLDQPREVRP